MIPRSIERWRCTSCDIDLCPGCHEQVQGADIAYTGVPEKIALNREVEWKPLLTGDKPNFVAAGPLPPGMTVEKKSSAGKPAGTLHGRPSEKGKYTVKVVSRGRFGRCRTKLCFSVGEAPVKVWYPGIPELVQAGTEIVWPPMFEGPEPTDWQAKTVLPKGLSLMGKKGTCVLKLKGGTIHGNCTRPGFHEVEIVGNNEFGSSEVCVLRFNVGWAPKVKYATVPVHVQIGSNVRWRPRLTHGEPQSIISKTPLEPLGLMMDSSPGNQGTIFGTVCQPGVFEVEVVAKNIFGSCSVTLSFNVVRPPSRLEYPTVPELIKVGKVGKRVSWKPQVEGGEPKVSFRTEFVEAACERFGGMLELPRGLSLNSETGEISGTVVEPVHKDIKIVCSNEYGESEVVVEIRCKEVEEIEKHAEKANVRKGVEFYLKNSEFGRYIGLRGAVDHTLEQCQQKALAFHLDRKIAIPWVAEDVGEGDGRFWLKHACYDMWIHPIRGYADKDDEALVLNPTKDTTSEGKRHQFVFEDAGNGKVFLRCADSYGRYVQPQWGYACKDDYTLVYWKGRSGNNYKGQNPSTEESGMFTIVYLHELAEAEQYEAYRKRLAESLERRRLEDFGAEGAIEDAENDGPKIEEDEEEVVIEEVQKNGMPLSQEEGGQKDAENAAEQADDAPPTSAVEER